MPQDLRLRVMTFNLLTATKKRRSHPWRLRKRNIAKIFGNLKPDVVGTQEANYQQLLELAELLPDYEFVGEGNLGRGKEHDAENWYCATFFRKERIRPVLKACGNHNNHTEWLSPTPHVPASQFHLGTRPRVVTWNTFELVASGQQFVFGTTHLEAINRGHRKKSARQLRQFVDNKVAEMGPETPVFLTGDFNAVSSSPEIRDMSADHGKGSTPLYDAWAESYTGDEPHCGGTFRGLGLRDKVSHRLIGPRRIDYVFFRPRMAIHSIDRISFEGLEHRESALPSDHYPVLAEFSLAV